MQTAVEILLRTSLFLAIGGILCALALRRNGRQLPRFERILWLLVLICGWFWVRPMIPITYETVGIELPPPDVVLAEETGVPNNVEFAENFRLPQRSNFKPQMEIPAFAPKRPELPENPQPEVAENVATEDEISASEEKNITILSAFEEWKPVIFSAIFATWIGGMVVSIFLAGFGYVRFLIAMRKTVPGSDDFAEPWERLLEEHAIDSRSIPMLISESRENLGPALIRTFRGYRLVIPRELWSELSETGRRGILRHELEHFRRRDVWKSFFVRILALPHWFNPFAHLAVHRFEEAAEQLCDLASFSRQKEGAIEFARTLLLLHENAPTRFVARHSIFGRGLKYRLACLLNENHDKKVSTMKKILLITGAVAFLAVALFQIQFIEKIVAQDAPPAKLENVEKVEKAEPKLPDFNEDTEQKIMDSAIAAHDIAKKAVGGDFASGTFEQQVQLFHTTETLFEKLSDQGKKEEADKVFAEFEEYAKILKNMAETTTDPEIKDAILYMLSDTHDMYAMIGDVEKAIEMAKLSPETHQYNPSEYLARVARIIAHKKGFPAAIPILDEAIEEAKKLPRLFWQELGIRDVAEIYEEAGLSEKADELVNNLSAEGRIGGTFDLLAIRKRKGLEVDPVKTIDECVELAETISDKEDRQWQLYLLATKFIDIGEIEKGTQLFEKADLKDSKFHESYNDEFQVRIAYYYLRNNRMAEAESVVDEKILLDSNKASVLMEILRTAKEKNLDKDEQKRLVKKAEPLVELMGPNAHRLHDLMQLSAYKIMIGEEAEGRAMREKLLAGPYIEGLDRSDAVHRAVIGLANVGLYDEAKNLIEAENLPPTWRGACYSVLESIYLRKEKPVEYQKRIEHWEIPDASTTVEADGI